MNERLSLWSPRRFRRSWKLFKAFRAEAKGNFDRALQLLDEVAQVRPLKAAGRVYRADLLLRLQRIDEAHAAFAALRDEFKGSDDTNLQYLRHYCTHQLSLLAPSSSQWSYEAKKAKLIACRASLKRRFPMPTVDDPDDEVEALLMAAMDQKQTLGR